jgi:glutaconate CoA-transferase, subunit A
VAGTAANRGTQSCRDGFCVYGRCVRLTVSILRGYTGTDLPRYNQNIRFVQCPFTGERLAAVPALQPDVAIIHAQKADRRGNVLMWGIVGIQKEAALCAKRVVVTVEEIVEDLHATPNASILPFWTVDAVVKFAGGASPSYAMDYYERDNGFYKRWDEISRTREGFLRWLNENVFCEQSALQPVCLSLAGAGSEKL